MKAGFSSSAFLIFFVLILGVIAPSADAAGGRTPQDVVQSIVSDLKSQRTPEVVLKYVHWPTAFSGLSDTERGRMGVKGPDDLQKYYGEFFSDPHAFFERELSAQGRNSPEMKRQVEQVVSMLTKKRSEMEAKIDDTRYEIGESRVEGDKAHVILISSLQGEVHREPVPLVRIESLWYLPSPSAAGSVGAETG